jgi:putative ABC transport system permease protein
MTGVARPRFALIRWLWAGQWRASPGRAATAVVAIAIGVALGLAIHLVNRSALGEFGAAIAVVNGEAQAQLKAAAGSFDEALFERIVNDPRVVAASPVLETDVQWLPREAVAGAGIDPRVRAGRSTSLRIIGIDVMRAAAVTRALLPAGDGAGSASSVFADDAIFLSPAAQQEIGAQVGERIALRVGLDTVRLRVAGSVPGAAPGQRLAVMDLGAAQWRLGWLGRLSRIDLRLAPGTDPAALAAALGADLPTGVTLVAPEAAQQRMSNLSRAYRVNLNVLALVALFTGGFIVYATLALAVVRQLPELAMLGVLGAPRGLAMTTVLGQGAALGVVGAVLGLFSGVGLAQLMLALVGGDLGGGYFRGTTPSLSIDVASLLLFGALGIAVGLAGSAAPALALRGLAPARALRSGSAEQMLSRRHAAGWALALFALGSMLLLVPPVEGLPIAAYCAIALWLFGGIAAVPVVTRIAGALLARAGRCAWRDPPWWFALQRIQGAPGSASASLSGVVASFALASAMAIMVHSFRDSVDRWLDTVLPADVYARSAGGAANAALTARMQQRLAEMPGVSRVQFLRGVEVSLDPARPPVALLSRPLDAAKVRQQLPITGEVLAAPPGTIAIYVSEAMVDLYGYAPGREVALPLGATRARFYVSGVWRDYARQHGAMMIAQDDYRRLTGDDSVSDASLWLAPGTDPQRLLERVRTELPELESMDWRSAAEVRELSLRIFDRSFAVTYVLEAIAIVVGLFGVAATYAGEALARAREFGMLRHLGVTRGQIGRLFAIESGVLIVTGVAWGGAVGALIAWVLVHRVNPQSFHWTMDIAWPASLLAASATALVLLGVAAAVLASRSATGGSPVRAVREDW